MVVVNYPQIGVCGLSCRICPRYHTTTESRCEGCKTESRMYAGCPFVNCVLKKQGVEFCWECKTNEKCQKWQKHRDYGKLHDSFKCYQKQEEDINYILNNGVVEFETRQLTREDLLRRMLCGFNEGRSKSYYCIAATVMETDELQAALLEAEEKSGGLEIKERARLLHSILDKIAMKKGYLLRLRK